MGKNLGSDQYSNPHFGTPNFWSFALPSELISFDKLIAKSLKVNQNMLFQKLIENLTKWVNYNGLALNLKKTQYMIFSRSKVELPTPLLILGKLIERKQEARFLGVIVDESLNWMKHIKTIQSKMAH